MSIAKPQTASIIETLNQGFAAVNRRLWVVAIPLLLNLYLAYGAQISLRPLVQNFAALMQRLAPETNGTAVVGLYDSWRNAGDYDLVQRFDVLELVPRLTFYSLERAQDDLPVPQRMLPMLEQRRVVFNVSDGSVAALLFLLTNLLLIPVGAVFLTMIASAVRDQRLSPLAWLRQQARAVAAILGYSAILLAATLIVGAPLLLVSSLFVVAVPPLGLLAIMLLFIIVFWINFYIGFAPEAITVGELDPIQAIRASFALVRRNFWATVGLLLLSFVITVGLGVVWTLLSNYRFGLLAAIPGSAYIGTGLVAARMVFYRERVRTQEKRDV